MVSPRKSRKKSPCFSRTWISTPARASRQPTIIPHGPPPTMQQRVEIGSAVMCECYAKAGGEHALPPLQGEVGAKRRVGSCYSKQFALIAPPDCLRFARQTTSPFAGGIRHAHAAHPLYPYHALA